MVVATIQAASRNPRKASGRMAPATSNDAIAAPTPEALYEGVKAIRWDDHLGPERAVPLELLDATDADPLVGHQEVADPQHDHAARRRAHAGQSARTCTMSRFWVSTR